MFSKFFSIVCRYCMYQITTFIILLSLSTKVKMQSTIFVFIFPYPTIYSFMGNHSKAFYITTTLYLFGAIPLFQ